MTQTYYVSTTGSDGNDGLTVTTPWATVAKALQSAVAGSIVYVRGGSYSPGTSILAATSRSTYVTIRPYFGEKVIFTNQLVLGRPTSSSNDGNIHCTMARFMGMEFQAGVAVSWGCRDIEILDCTFTGGGGTVDFKAILIQDGCERIRVEDNIIDLDRTDTNTGIFLSSSSSEPQICDIFIRRNYIRPTQVGINLRGFVNCVVEDNEICDIDYDGVSHTDCIRTFGGGAGLRVRRNFIHDCEGLGFFIKDGAVSDVDFTDNVVVRMVGSFAAFNVYDTAGIRVLNNTLDGSCTWQQTATPSVNIVCANNIFATHAASGTTPAFDYRDYNLTENNAAGGSFTAAPNDTVNQLATYTNEADDDYTLTSVSPGLNAGTGGPVNGWVITSLDQRHQPRPFGASVDMGALERQTV